MTPRRVLPPSALALAAALAGCVPPRTPPPALSAVAAPPAWRDTPTGTAVIDPRWWQAFGDPVLTRLVEAALARNTDVLAAAARVDEARANARIARADLLPEVDAGLSAGRSRSLVGTSGAASTSIEPDLSASWEVDLFGRLRNLTRAARLRYVASKADRDATALSVAAETAQSYITLLSYDTQLEISRETVRTRLEALRLAEDQARVGYSSQFELTQAQSEYESVAQEIPRLQLAITSQENALRVLTGELPGPVERGQILGRITPPTVPATMPADLLRRRPDIASAELGVAAADATLAARRAEFLPQVTLSGSLGAVLVNALDYDPVTVWSLGSSILAPIFAGGRLTARVDLATAQRNEAAFTYRGTVLGAFEEVETALTGNSRYAEQIARVHNRRLILIRSLELARDRYQGGYGTYLDQLDAQRNLYSTEIDGITLRENQLNNIVVLYRALGGGWSTSDIDTPSGL